MAEWKLYYWPKIAGRGDYIRLIFEEAGVQYEDVSRNQGLESILKYYQGRYDGPPVLFPPIIENKSGFLLCQVSAIMPYLGKLLNMYPEGGPDIEARAMQVILVAADMHAEAHDAYHPVDKHASYESQKDEAAPQIERFKRNRLPKYLLHIEAFLCSNNDGNGFFFGDKITYVDIVIFHLLRSAESQFPAEYQSIEIPKLRGFKERIAARPNIAAFLSSPRAIPFNGNSMM